MSYTSTQSASIAEVTELIINPSSKAHTLLKEAQVQLEATLEGVKTSSTGAKRVSEIQQIVMNLETVGYVLCHVQWVDKSEEPAITLDETLAGVQLRISHNHLPLGTYVPEADMFRPMFDEAWTRIVALTRSV